MRIHLKISTSKELIPFDHQPLLTGTIHKWLGWNKEHHKISLYSFSQLTGGKPSKEGLKFGSDTTFFFSSYNSELIKKIISGIQKDPEMFFELKVREIIIQEDPELSDVELFYPGSPIFIKRRNDD